MIERVKLTYDPRTDRDALVIDGELVPLACKCRPYIMERLADLRISEPDSDEIDRLERERDVLFDGFADVLDALHEVAKLLRDDLPKAALQVAEKALGIDP